jgi:two-component system phosphate regulon sensor histidine kinase PhoR
VFRSIRWRIATPFVIFTLITMSGLGWYLYNDLRQTYLQELESQIGAQARLTAETLTPIIAQGAQPGQLDALASRWAGVLQARVTIIASDGRVIGESSEQHSQLDNLLRQPEVALALSKGYGSAMRVSSTQGTEMLYVAVPLVVSGNTMGVVRLEVPLQRVQTVLAQVERTLAAATLIAALAAAILAALIAERISQPLHQLTQAVLQFSSGEFNEEPMPSSRDEAGQLTQAFNHMSARLQNQFEEIQAERSKLAAIVQEMSDGLLIVDASGRVQLVNPAAENMFGLKRGESVGHTLAEVLRHHHFVELWQRCRDTGQTQNATLEIGARRLYLQSVVTPLNQASPGSALMLFTNLTRQRHLETVRRDFISNISHELRTPLASLKALTETLQEGALEDPPAARRFLGRMETEVDALSQMVSELLELSRIESGRVPLQLQPTLPEDILKSAADRLRLQAERAGLKISIDCPPDLPEIQADETRLVQVMVNLMHNAIKFTPPGGSITVKAAQLPEEILFSVQDTGVGIPASDLPRIFERFYKADRARSSGGTGLGLAIARHTIELHDGKIWAESGEGEGSTFYFTIPIVF